jgi:hypothetical protein
MFDKALRPEFGPDLIGIAHTLPALVAIEPVSLKRAAKYFALEMERQLSPGLRSFRRRLV